MSEVKYIGSTTDGERFDLGQVGPPATAGAASDAETWWKEDEHQISTVEYNDSFIVQLAGRQVDGEWEYALVHWRYKVPTLKVIFRAGKVTKEADG